MLKTSVSCRDVAQLGSASGSGPEGRGFESHRSDHFYFEHIKQLSTNNSEIRAAFYKGLIVSSVKKHDIDLKEKIEKIYLESKTIFATTNIQEIYLFGSVVDDTYCDNSDIDLVIKVKNEEDFEESRLFLKEFNKRYFDRKSNIQEYNAFREHDSDLPYERLY